MSSSRAYDDAVNDRMDPNEARWFALRTSSRHEKVAVRQLERDGIECFLPLHRVRREYRRKIVQRELCLLPGYVFVKLVTGQVPFVYHNPWANFLRVGKDRLDVSEEEIEILRRIIGERSLDLEWELQPKTGLEAGQLVELVGGQLTGMRGTYLKTHNNSYFLISLGLLPDGMGLRTQVPAAFVRPLAVGVSDAPIATNR